jgi:hypothetical protein
MNPSLYNDRNNALLQMHARMKTEGLTEKELSDAHIMPRPGEDTPASRFLDASFKFYKALLAAGIDMNLSEVMGRTALAGCDPLDENYIATLLFLLGKYHEDNPFLGLGCPRFTYFNGKWMCGIESYIDFVARLIFITNRSLKIAITGGLLDKNTGEAWIDILYTDTEVTESWEITDHGKFLTGELYGRLQGVAAKRGGSSKFWNMSDGGEDMVFIFASESLIRQIPMTGKFSLTEAWQGAKSN